MNQLLNYFLFDSYFLSHSYGLDLSLEKANQKYQWGQTSKILMEKGVGKKGVPFLIQFLLYFQ